MNDAYIFEFYLIQNYKKLEFSFQIPTRFKIGQRKFANTEIKIFYMLYIPVDNHNKYAYNYHDQFF